MLLIFKMLYEYSHLFKGTDDEGTRLCSFKLYIKLIYTSVFYDIETIAVLNH